MHGINVGANFKRLCSLIFQNLQYVDIIVIFKSEIWKLTSDKLISSWDTFIHGLAFWIIFIPIHL